MGMHKKLGVGPLHDIRRPDWAVCLQASSIGLVAESHLSKLYRDGGLRCRSFLTQELCLRWVGRCR